MCLGHRDGREGVHSIYGHNGAEWCVLLRFCWQSINNQPLAGRGTGIVIATGTQAELGIIFSMMQDVEERRTPLQNNMDELAKRLSIISFGVIGVICLIGVFQNRPWLEMFTIGGAPWICDSEGRKLKSYG
jgi:hypothetical protein